MSEKIFCIGGYNVRLYTDICGVLWAKRKSYQLFSINTYKGLHIDINLEICSCPEEKMWSKNTSSEFIWGESWKYYSTKEYYIFKANYQETTGRRRRLLVLNKNLKEGKIYIDLKLNELYTYEYGELLLVLNNLLNWQNGTILHCTGVMSKEDKKVNLFLGKSGQGKSTLAGLYKQCAKEYQILNDDRIIVRQNKKMFSCYGNPWHSAAKTYSPKDGKLKNIYILEKSTDNYLNEVSKVEAFYNLIVNSFYPYWNLDLINKANSLYEHIIKNIKFYRLGLNPTKGVVKYIASNQ